eukprot:6402380-Amphidinium_carterae.1
MEDTSPTLVSAHVSTVPPLWKDNQLQLVSERVWAADALCVLDSDWAGRTISCVDLCSKCWLGRTVLRGLCLLVAGLVEVMQGAATRGAIVAHDHSTCDVVAVA